MPHVDTLGPPRGPVDARRRNLAAGACLLQAGRWLKALEVERETARDFLAEVAPTVERAALEGDGVPVILSRTAKGLAMFAGAETAPLEAFYAAQAAQGADFLGLNPAGMLREITLEA